MASGAVIPNLGKIEMKSMDESGIERTVRRNITEVSKPLLSAAEASKRWDSILFEDGGILLERRSPCCLRGPSNFEKAQGLDRHGKNIRLYREGNLYNAYVRTGDVTQELAPVEPAEESWTRVEVDDGQRDKQEESEDQPEELRRVLEAPQPTELERQKHSKMNNAVFAPWCDVCVKAEGTRAPHRRQTNKELAKQAQWTQNLLRFLLHERGRSFDANACIEIQQSRQDGSHSFGTERIDAVRSEILCGLHSANWSSNVHQQE